MYRLTMREQAIRFLQRIPGSRDVRRMRGEPGSPKHSVASLSFTASLFSI